MLRLLASISSQARGVFGCDMVDSGGLNGSPFITAFRFLSESNRPHWLFNCIKSASASLSSSRSSSTRLSWAAMAWMKSFASVGERAMGVSFGVGGYDGGFVVVGIGRDE